MSTTLKVSQKARIEREASEVAAAQAELATFDFGKAVRIAEAIRRSLNH